MSVWNSFLVGMRYLTVCYCIAFSWLHSADWNYIGNTNIHDCYG